MEVVGAKGATATDHPSQNLDSGHSCFHLDPILDRRDRTPIGLFSEMVQDEGEDEDYFAHFGELELTEEDLACIDRTCEEEFCTPVPEPVPPLSESKGEAQVTVEVEREPQSVTEAVSLPPAVPPPTPVLEPPYDAFRSGKSLSVSDLIGPLWCVDW